MAIGEDAVATRLEAERRQERVGVVGRRSARRSAALLAGASRLPVASDLE